MRRILALVLLLMLLPAALAAQTFLVLDNGLPSNWLKKIPAGYEDVLAGIARVDAKAAKSENVYFYPDGDGCWVFCRTKADVFQTGSFWYVNGENVYHLGSSKDVWDQDYFTGEGVFYSAIGEPENRTINAAIAVDGVPKLLKIPENIVHLHGMNEGKALCGMVDTHDYDYRFLTVDGDTLRELEPVPMEPSEFTALPGAQEMLIELTETNPRLQSASFLRYDNGIITLNAELDDGTWQHGYFWVAYGTLQTERGWEFEISLLDGTGGLDK